MEKGPRNRKNVVVPVRGPREALNDWIRSLGEALQQTWSYMLFGVVVGGILAYASSRLTGSTGVKHFFEELFEHLSNGLFVSAIAVLFYEWGSHAKHALHLSNQLGELLRSKSELAIAEGMRGLFPDWQGLCDTHGKFIESLKVLNDHKNRGRDADMQFLALFVEHGEMYAEQLLTVRKHLGAPHDEDERPFHLDFTKLDYADNILTHWMGLLGHGDTYVTLSNPRTWSALKRGKFRDSGGPAVRRGVHIRRIFVMDHENDVYSPNDIHNLIGHYQFAADRKKQAPGTYEIQIATKTVYEPRNIKPENQHYGVFTARFGFREGDESDKPASVAFKVMDGNVENFELVVVKPNGDLVRNFDEIWESLQLSKEGPLIDAKGRPTVQGPGRFLDAVLTREVKKLTERGGTFCVEIVSTPESWASKELHHDTPALDKAIANYEVRHLFVLDKEKQRTDLASSVPARTGAAAWSARTVIASNCDDPVRHWLVPQWRIVEVRDGVRKSLHDCVFKLTCKSDLSDFFLTKADSPVTAADYAWNFSEVWNVATPL